MAAVISEDPNGIQGIGAAFHIGDGYLLTARHVVEKRRKIEVIPYNYSYPSVEILEVIFPEDASVDLAMLRTTFSLDFYMNHTKIMLGGSEWTGKVDHVQIGTHLDDWLDDSLVLSEVVLMGYPPIPLSSRLNLVAVKGEINSIIDPYSGSRHPLFVISPIARGGFSGGPVLHFPSGWLIGVLTTSLVNGNAPPELGYHAALTVEPIWNLLFAHDIFPASNREVADLIIPGWQDEDDS